MVFCYDASKCFIETYCSFCLAFIAFYQLLALLQCLISTNSFIQVLKITDCSFACNSICELFVFLPLRVQLVSINMLALMVLITDWLFINFHAALWQETSHFKWPWRPHATKYMYKKWTDCNLPKGFCSNKEQRELSEILLG